MGGHVSDITHHVSGHFDSGVIFEECYSATEDGESCSDLLKLVERFPQEDSIYDCYHWCLECEYVCMRQESELSRPYQESLISNKHDRWHNTFHLQSNIFEALQFQLFPIMHSQYYFKQYDPYYHSFEFPCDLHEGVRTMHELCSHSRGASGTNCNHEE